jgi:hypothetical protein
MVSHMSEFVEAVKMSDELDLGKIWFFNDLVVFLEWVISN